MRSAERDPAFEALLDLLKRSRGFDFTGYKRPSLERRFRRRMEAIGCRSYGDYLDYLEVHPEEFGQLFDLLLINVTEFFRDPPAWQHLSEAVLPGLLEAKPASRSGSGVPAALPARRRTPLRSCLPRRSERPRTASG